MNAEDEKIVTKALEEARTHNYADYETAEVVVDAYQMTNEYKTLVQRIDLMLGLFNYIITRLPQGEQQAVRVALAKINAHKSEPTTTVTETKDAKGNKVFIHEKKESRK